MRRSVCVTLGTWASIARRTRRSQPVLPTSASVKEGMFVASRIALAVARSSKSAKAEIASAIHSRVTFCSRMLGHVAQDDHVLGAAFQLKQQSVESLEVRDDFAVRLEPLWAVVGIYTARVEAFCQPLTMDGLQDRDLRRGRCFRCGRPAIAGVFYTRPARRMFHARISEGRRAATRRPSSFQAQAASASRPRRSAISPKSAGSKVHRPALLRRAGMTADRAAS